MNGENFVCHVNAHRVLMGKFEGMKGHLGTWAFKQKDKITVVLRKT
jgi:hypothetical protein